MRLLDFPIAPVSERTVDTAWLSYRMKEGFRRSFSKPFTQMTMRSAFDAMLAEKAVEAGAELKDGFKVERIEIDSDGLVTVRGGQDAFSSRVLAGADGVNGVTALHTGLEAGRELGVGLEAEVYTDQEQLERWKRSVAIDFGMVRGGYMWLFPKEDHLSIGVASFPRHAHRLRDLLAGYLKYLDLGDFQQKLTRGHRLPRRKKGAPITKGPVLLVGDAAGMLDYWTGEGIFYAIRSGQIAAPAAVDYLEGKTPDMTAYEKVVDDVDDEIMPDLMKRSTAPGSGLQRDAAYYDAASGGVHRLTSRAGAYRVSDNAKFEFAQVGPQFTMMKRSDRAWSLGCRVLRGDAAYYDIRGVWGPFKFMFDLAGRGI